MKIYFDAVDLSQKTHKPSTQRTLNSIVTSWIWKKERIYISSDCNIGLKDYNSCIKKLWIAKNS